jgi:phage terminase small subunit
MARLTDKMKRFCLEYLVDLNGTQAAIRAGYSPETARQIAVQNLSKLNIQAEIARLQRERQERTEITADKVLRELAYQSFARITGVCDFSKKGLVLKDSATLPDWEVATIQEVGQIEMGRAVKTYVKQHSKAAVLKLLMQHLGLTNDFNQAIATLRKYGLIVRQRPDGTWEVVEAGEESSSSPTDEG